MNNIDRIQQELEKEAETLGPEVGLSPDRFLEVVLEIVNAEDKHRISRTNIRQQVRTIVLNSALTNDEKGS